MSKLQKNQILVKGAKLTTNHSKMPDSVIQKTIKRQQSILKLKQIDQNQLKMIVQL